MMMPQTPNPSGSDLFPGGPLRFCRCLPACLLRYRLNLSRLNLSPLRTRRTTPSLKNFSSPVAVRPPMYSLSAPRTSRKPSLLLSLPRRRPAPFAGCGIGIAPCDRGECMGSWPMTPPRCAEEEAAWGFEEEDMARGAEAGP